MRFAQRKQFSAIKANICSARLSRGAYCERQTQTKYNKRRTRIVLNSITRTICLAIRSVFCFTFVCRLDTVLVGRTSSCEPTNATTNEGFLLRGSSAATANRTAPHSSLARRATVCASAAIFHFCAPISANCFSDSGLFTEAHVSVRAPRSVALTGESCAPFCSCDFGFRQTAIAFRRSRALMHCLFHLHANLARFRREEASKCKSDATCARRCLLQNKAKQNRTRNTKARSKVIASLALCSAFWAAIAR